MSRLISLAIYFYHGLWCLVTLKTCLMRPFKKRHNKDLKDKWKINVGLKYCRMLIEHSAILLTCIKQFSVLKTNFWSSFEWQL